MPGDPTDLKDGLPPVDAEQVTQQLDRAPDPGAAPGAGRDPVAPAFAAVAALAELPVARLEPPSGRASLGAAELWHHRELLYFLALRDVKLRYRQTALGAAWVLLQPVITMVLFTLVFRKIGHVASDGVPYPVFSLTSLVPWTFFSTAIGTVALSLVNNASLVGKVYFPRLAVPLGAALAALVDLAVGLVLVLVVCLATGHLSLRFPLVLPVVLLALLAVMGPGLLLATLNVRYRDVRYVVPFLVQTFLFVSPVAYPVSLVSTWLRPVYALNPMVGVLETWRWALLGTDGDLLRTLPVSLVSALVMAYAGLRYFRSREQTFADVI